MATAFSRVVVGQVLAVTLLSGVMLVAGGCGWSAEHTCYGVACEALKTDPNIPKGAVPRSIAEAELYVGKSAARVDLPYDCASAGTQMTTACYTVWCKRIERRWLLDRAAPRPKFPPAP
jgi:hypothetical protein